MYKTKLRHSAKELLYAVQVYDVLCERLKEISTLNGVRGLLMWDEMVGFSLLYQN